MRFPSFLMRQGTTGHSFGDACDYGHLTGWQVSKAGGLGLVALVLPAPLPLPRGETRPPHSWPRALSLSPHLSRP